MVGVFKCKVAPQNEVATGGHGAQSRGAIHAGGVSGRRDVGGVMRAA
jgi:hypothetical protein